MFVKVILKKQTGRREIIYECGKVDTEQEDSKVILELEGCSMSLGKERVSIPYFKKDLISIYLMNDQGKTIDSLHFEDKNGRSNHR